jgi:UDP-2,3-diacylglucosamine pyrophosphatase LpxH
MLVFISDLHISDRTAGVQFLPRRAYELAFREIAQQAQDADSQEFEIVYLGDIIDLIRTTYWYLDVPENQKPWWNPVGEEARAAHHAAVTRHCLTLLDNTQTANADVFELLSGPLWDEDVVRKPTRTYIPGNHDRPCNQFAELRQRVNSLLALNWDPAHPFANEYYNPRYRTFARHGHEFDVYNSEFLEPLSRQYRPIPFEHYLQVPIGDAIAAEIGAALHIQIERSLQKTALSAKDRELIASQFKAIDDVRPLTAIIPWLFNRLRKLEVHQPEVLDEIGKGIRELVRRFRVMKFTQDWFRRHDGFLPLDAADRLQAVLAALGSIDVRHLATALEIAEGVISRFPSENLADEAESEFKRQDTRADGGSPIQYVLYGHTHTPAQLPIDTLFSEGDQLGRPRVYLNTGTWRPRYRQARSRNGFLSWKNLTFTLIYHPHIDPKSPAAELGYPTFETWTGSLLEKPENLAQPT